MKQLAYDNNMLFKEEPLRGQIQPADCSARLLEVVPSIMRHIRKELRSRAMQGLTVPQFRALNYLRRHPDASLSSVAEHLGLTPPTVSKMIQKLVEQGIIIRNSASDRRQVRLSLSAAGISALTQAREETRKQLAENLKTLSQEELKHLLSTLEILEHVFSKNGTNVNISQTL
ncbi:MAG TPA: MarR family transcriptional regulator [Dehalococcoidia bacterium]|nr:MarR family transcriptional regulator [Dehalococcoidia bacterium]